MINKETYEAMERIDKLSIELATAFIKSQNIIIAELQNDIECQKAEIEKLKSENLVLSQNRITMPERLEIVNKARDKAIRDFAEKLKTKIAGLEVKSPNETYK